MISWVGLLEASVSGGICIVLFFVISQLCGEKYPAKYKKVIWFLIGLRLCIPISLSLLPQVLTVKVPVYVFHEREKSGVAGILLLTWISRISLKTLHVLVQPS